MRIFSEVICDLFGGAFGSLDYMLLRYVDAVVDCKKCERKRSWPGGAEVHDNERHSG